uniref:Ubiquitin domain-containing protein DSK2b n=1 Tax=Zea mays TaxID=4577 RepID=A0A804R4M4_MAIZE
MASGGEGAGSGESPPAASVEAAAVEATLHIRCANGSKFTVQTDLGATVGAFKEVLSGSCGVPAPQQRLIYKGRILKDEQTLDSYGVETDHTIHLVRGVATPAASSAPAAANPLASFTPSSGPAGGLGGLFPGVDAPGNDRPSGIFRPGFPELEQVEQHLSQNPNLMREIMNMPAMQNLMNNPDLIRNMIMNNPQMREIMDRNPDLAHVLNDPSVLRQTLEAARNPEIMREMMRNTDRAMSNIESSPEGFNMLRRMYETVQEPFLNATTMGGEGSTASNPFSALLGNQGSSQPGQGQPATNAPTTGSESTTGTPAPNTNPLPNPWSTNAGSAQGATRTPSGNARTGGVGGTGATGGLGGLGSPELSSLLGGLAGSPRTGSAGGLGGSGSPDLGSMLGGSPDVSPFSQMLQNPAMIQMMQNIMSDPQTMNQLLNLNPNARNLMESNTHMREMFQNPEFLRQLTSPETLQTLLGQLGQHQPSQGGNNAGSATGTRGNPSLDTLMSMLSGLGSGGGLGVPNTSSVPPEELYATQLTQLQEMGFIDTAENIQALVATAGNVHAAVERLLGNLGQ